MNKYTALTVAAVFSVALSYLYDNHKQRNWVESLKPISANKYQVSYRDSNGDFIISTDNPSDGLLHQDKDGLVDEVLIGKPVTGKRYVSMEPLENLGSTARKELTKRHHNRVMTYLLNNNK